MMVSWSVPMCLSSPCSSRLCPSLVSYLYFRRKSSEIKWFLHRALLLNRSHFTIRTMIHEPRTLTRNYMVQRQCYRFRIWEFVRALVGLQLHLGAAERLVQLTPFAVQRLIHIYAFAYVFVVQPQRRQRTKQKRWLSSFWCDLNFESTRIGRETQELSLGAANKLMKNGQACFLFIEKIDGEFLAIFCCGIRRKSQKRYICIFCLFISKRRKSEWIQLDVYFRWKEIRKESNTSIHASTKAIRMNAKFWWQ